MPAETKKADDKEIIVATVGPGAALAGALPSWDLLPEAPLVRRR